MTEHWKNIRDGNVPMDRVVCVANETTGDVWHAYAYWGRAPFPLWLSVDPTGVGPCKPTHWRETPAFEPAERASEPAE